MKSLLMFIFLFVGQNLIAHAETQSDSKVDIKSLSFIEDSFGSYKSLVDGFRQMGLLDNDDEKALINFLETNKIELKQNPVHSIVEENKITWGKFKLTLLGKNEYKTNLGNIIKFSDSESPGKKIARIVRAFNAKTFSKTELFIPSAYAALDGNSSALEAATIKTYILDKVETGFQGVTTGYGVILGGAGVAAKGIGYMVRKFITDGSVTCNGKKYEEVNGFTSKDYMDHYAAWSQICKEEKNLSGSTRAPDSMTVKFCAFYTSATDYMNEAFHPQLKKVFIPDDWLKKMYHGEPPACTEDNARIVQGVLKSQGNKLFEMPPNAKSSTPSEGFKGIN